MFVCLWTGSDIILGTSQGHHRKCLGTPQKGISGYNDKKSSEQSVLLKTSRLMNAKTIINAKNKLIRATEQMVHDTMLLSILVGIPIFIYHKKTKGRNQKFNSNFLKVINKNRNIHQWRIQDFPEEGAPTPRGGRQPMILSIFSENCMKMKKFWPRGGGRASPAPPLRSATVHTFTFEIDDL